MKYEYTPEKITILLDNPRQREMHKMDISSLCVIPPDEVERLLLATFKRLEGKSYKTQICCLRAGIYPLVRYMQQRGLTSLPTSFNDWQVLIFDFYAWYLSNASSTASIEIRVYSWTVRVVLWLRRLMEENVLPSGLVLPDDKFPDEAVNTGSPARPSMIGDKPARPTEKPINKTHAGPVFWLDDVKYLDEIEAILRQRNELLKKVADDHWLMLVKDYRVGRNMLRRISDEALADRVSRNFWHAHPIVTASECAPGNPLVTSPRQPNGDAWVLRLMQHRLETSDDEACFSTIKLRSHPALGIKFPRRNENSETSEIHSKTSLRADQIPLMPPHRLCMRFLGVLLHVDMAVACCILIQEHPNLTPESLSEAKILNTKGKDFLIVTDKGGRSIFSVDKPRAGTRKYAPLTRRANKVMRHLLRATAPVRELLKSTGAKHWRYLFIGCCGAKGDLLGHPRISTAHLTNKSALSLVRFYPELEAGGLDMGTLGFAKIRTTQGVLEWFDTGSLRQVSRKLGNTYQVVLEHYIPKPLIRLWNERIIRRFQNTLITLASHREDYALDVTDFRDYSELQEFIAQVVAENPAGSSPIADQIDRIFGERQGADHGEAPVADGSLLTVRLDAESLALLYAFRHISVSRIPPDALQHPDPLTCLTPKYFVDLAALLAHAAESDTVNEALRESLDLARLKRTHDSAIAKLPQFLEELENLHIDTTWSAP